MNSALGGGVSWSKPIGLVCHICGREYGTASLAIHLPQCAQLWKDRQKLLPKSERRPVPKANLTIQQLQSVKIDSKDSDAIAKFNEQQFGAFVEKSLIPCEHCGRRFLTEKLPVHQKSCTAERPAAAVGSHRIKEADPFNKAAKNANISQITNSSSNNNKFNNSSSSNNNSSGGFSNKSSMVEESKGEDDFPIPSKGYDLSQLPDESPSDAVDMSECSICQRHFATDRLAKHEAICAKTHSKSAAKPQTKTQPQARPATSAAPARADDGKWKSKHSEFQATIQYAKKLQAMQAAGVSLSSLPPPPRSENADYVSCPHCNRRFNQTAAERHIPSCANTINKPKPPPQLRPKTTATAPSIVNRTPFPPAATAPPSQSMNNNSSLSVTKSSSLTKTQSPRVLGPVRPKGKSPNFGAINQSQSPAADVFALQSQLQALTATVSMLAQQGRGGQSSTCRSCQTSLSSGAKFCSNCGSAQS